MHIAAVTLASRRAAKAFRYDTPAIRAGRHAANVQRIERGSSDVSTSGHPADRTTSGHAVVDGPTRWHVPSGDHADAFARGLAHDLRAPLRSIDGFAAQIAAKAGDALDPASRDHLQRIRAAAMRMSALVDGLHLYAQAQRAPLRHGPVDLSLLAEWAGAELQDAEQSRPARITVAPGLAAEGDEHWLKVALKAVLQNAWTFSATRERVQIDVEGETIGDVLRLRVRDAGIGFDPAHGDALFQPFQRLHRPDEGAGTGLGLATAWCIVRRHGGRMRMRGCPGAGCTVEIELPLRAADGATAREGEVGAGGA